MLCRDLVFSRDSGFTEKILDGLVKDAEGTETHVTDNRKPTLIVYHYVINICLCTTVAYKFLDYLNV